MIHLCAYPRMPLGVSNIQEFSPIVPPDVSNLNIIHTLIYNKDKLKIKIHLDFERQKEISHLQ